MAYKTTTIFTCDVCKKQQISKERRYGLGYQKGYKKAFNSIPDKEWTVALYYDCKTATPPEITGDNYSPYRVGGVKTCELNLCETCFDTLGIREPREAQPVNLAPPQRMSRLGKIMHWLGNVE